jgi:hypothetical protein
MLRQRKCKTVLGQSCLFMVPIVEIRYSCWKGSYSYDHFESNGVGDSGVDEDPPPLQLINTQREWWNLQFVETAPRNEIFLVHNIGHVEATSR